MNFSICLALALVCACAAIPAFPKKYNKAIHGGKPSYGVYKKKYEYSLKAPEGESYNSVPGNAEDPLTPPAVYAYSSADGEAYEEMAPPPQEDEDDNDASSYTFFDGPLVDPLTPPRPSSYLAVSRNSDGSDAMAALSFMVGALPVDSTYSKYLADPNAEKMLPPDELPESTYLAYPAEAKSDAMEVPSSEPKKEKSISSYSSYA